MSPTIYEKCPHYIDASEQVEETCPVVVHWNHCKWDGPKYFTERISNRRVWIGCHPCLKEIIRHEWAKTELGRKTLAHMMRVDLIDFQGCTMHAPKGLLGHKIVPKEMPNGEVVMTPVIFMDDEFPVDISAYLPTEEKKPEAEAPKEESPVPPELKAFVEPIVAANAKFVDLWKNGKTGPLIGAVMREAKGKYEGKHIEAVLRELCN